MRENSSVEHSLGDPFHEAASLYRVASLAYERTKLSGGDRDAGQLDALIAVVFAAASLEAFINQAADLAARLTRHGHHHGDDAALRRYALLATEIENARGSTQLKYRVLAIALTGKQLDTGCRPFQDLVLLFRLRDQLVHLKNEIASPVPGAESEIDAPPKVIQQLRSRNVTAEDVPTTSELPWIDRICTRAMARWACNTASEVVGSIVELAPPDDFHTVLLVASMVNFPQAE